MCVQTESFNIYPHHRLLHPPNSLSRSNPQKAKNPHLESKDFGKSRAHVPSAPVEHHRRRVVIEVYRIWAVSRKREPGGIDLARAALNFDKSQRQIRSSRTRARRTLGPKRKVGPRNRRRDRESVSHPVPSSSRAAYGLSPPG